MKIQLPEEVSLYTAEELLLELRGLDYLSVGDGDILELDGSMVRHIDGCGLQILLSLKKTLQQQNIELQILNASNALKLVLSFL